MLEVYVNCKYFCTYDDVFAYVPPAIHVAGPISFALSEVYDEYWHLYIHISNNAFCMEKNYILLYTRE